MFDGPVYVSLDFSKLELMGSKYPDCTGLLGSKYAPCCGVPLFDCDWGSK